MTKCCMFFLMISLAFYCKPTACQEATVQRTVTGMQAELLGLHLYNESKIGNAFVLRSELGLRGTIFSGSFIDYRTIYVLTPIIVLEPRLYYNLKRRIEKEKSIIKNSGNFVSFKFAYQPSWFYISNSNGTTVDILTALPIWGIRRHIGNYFNYELGVGYGYSHVFNNTNTNAISGLHYYFHARFGFTL